ncbi:uncharacterized protein LOC118743575 [Rhagoletis pomonella]|uniref:uncharacterized protein LOC118743575 n=1 Tax=Rhagoletis pomonella TaxID=28610 RepID=UPI0017806942|nr:uncharacterized protein LOC118743575 [Rhagoletis pomonella]
MKNAPTDEETNKKVSAMNYYSYRLMIRQDAENHILKCRQLFHQYIVDMYAKIETERLLYIRLNQTELRSEEYIHLRDAIVNDGNVNPNELGRMVILPSTSTGSPRHMHEYAQDAMTYVCPYGRPDLFITFTCNPKWDEIKELLLAGQSSSDRHDITASVFKQKFKALMDFINKHHVFGETRCWMYSIEWQKRGLPHAHILVWLINKITPDQIDQIISAEIPYKAIDLDLFEVVTKNMIHGPSGAFNNNSHQTCMERYPRNLVSDTITGKDGYPLYRRRSVEDGGISIVLKVRNVDVEVDNRWVVPYSPLLPKTFKARINVEKHWKRLIVHCEIFGGVLILLSGDFRQTLPVIPRSTPADELNACLKSSVLWRHIQKVTLKTNMRVKVQRDTSAGNFAKELIDIGNGRMQIDDSTQCITLSANFCRITESIADLVQKVFTKIAQNYKNHQWLSTCAILAAKNIDVNTINITIQNGIHDETTTYKSIDTVVNQDEVVNYPTKFLNSLCQACHRTF